MQHIDQLKELQCITWLYIVMIVHKSTGYCSGEYQWQGRLYRIEKSFFICKM